MINEATKTTVCMQPQSPAETRQFFVSRHRGAIDWARKHPWSIRAEFVPHLDPASVSAGDVVIGTLPVHLVAQICARGAKYLHLTLELSAEQRGQELTVEALEAAGAHLVPYKVFVEHP
jgi:CRISPR-associated protein Csx16